MRILIVAITLVLAAHASAEQQHNVKFVIKGFYAGMSKEAFYKLAKLHGLEDADYFDRNADYFDRAIKKDWTEELLKRYRGGVCEPTAKSYAKWDRVFWNQNEQTEQMTVGGYPVKCISWSEGIREEDNKFALRDFPARIRFYFDVDLEQYEDQTPDGILNGLSARFGEPQHIKKRNCMDSGELAVVREDEPNAEGCYEWKHGKETMTLREGSPNIDLLRAPGTIPPELPEPDVSDF